MVVTCQCQIRKSDSLDYRNENELAEYTRKQNIVDFAGNGSGIYLEYRFHPENRAKIDKGEEVCTKEIRAAG